MRVAVLYYSHKGRTAHYAREIAMYLWSQGNTVSLSSISDFDQEKLPQIDALILGCWTSGWFVIHQHPHRKWAMFARSIADRLPTGIALFTTYKIRTGSMFLNMKRALGLRKNAPIPCLESRTGLPSDRDKETLTKYLNAISQSQQHK